MFLRKTQWVLLLGQSAFHILSVPKLRVRVSETVGKRNAQGSRKLSHFEIGPQSFFTFCSECEYSCEVGHDILSSEKLD